MNNDNVVQDPVSTDTPEPESNSPAVSDGGNEEAVDTNQVSGGIDPKEYENLKREKGKLKQVQEQLKQLKGQYENVSGWVAKDPERLKNALIETSGYTPEQAEQYVSQFRQPQTDSSLTKTQGESQAYVDPLDQLADQEARSVAKVRVVNRQQAIQKFIDDNQGNESPLENDDLEVLFARAGKLERKEGLTPAEAIKKAYTKIFDSDKLIEEAREEGELSGLATASSVGSSVMSSPLGTQPKRTAEPNVPNDEWETAQSLGFKDKAEYVLYRDNPSVGVS